MEQVGKCRGSPVGVHCVLHELHGKCLSDIEIPPKCASALLHGLRYLQNAS